MKKIIIILISSILIICLGVFIYLNRTVSEIILDINPSIKISLDRKGLVKKVTPLNEDAKEIISINFKGKNIEETIDIIAVKVIEKNYEKEGRVPIILYSEGKVDNKELKDLLIASFNSKGANSDITIIENISSEDKALARKYDITPSKASYINSIKDDIEDLPVEDMIDKSVGELSETKESGKYCDKDYTLEGDFCVKEIRRESAKEGIVCPIGYYDYNGKCYEEVGGIESGKLYCDEGFTLKDNMCYKKSTMDGEPILRCETGELPKEGEILKRGTPKDICVDKSNAKAPTLRCMIGPHKVIGGKCYVGPAPVINGGCPNGDKLVGGGCYSLDPEDQWQCPDGEIYMKSKGQNIELCPDTYKYIAPVIEGYTCPVDYTLEGSKCVKDEIINAFHERYCPDGYTKTDEDKCINKNNVKEKQNGYYCENDFSRLEGKECIIFEVKDAKRS